jgi:tRNA A-37 threonylcarbamoyl transferase component Bud32
MKRRPSSSDGPAPAVIEGVTDLERIGSGGFSVVYRGRETAMHRDVAVKVLNSGIATEAERRTFERECRALGQLSAHPNIVTVYRPAFTADQRPSIVMELYHGNYRERLDRTGPLPLDELLTVGVRIAGALHTAHQAGVLHRDLKPHNIFLSAYGEPALGDFGISTIDDERSHSGASGLSVAYAAPEVLEDSDASVAADIYSLGATLHHLAAGRAPFSSGDLRTTVRRILTESPPPLGRSDVPPGLDRALQAAMARDPADRPRTALAFAEMLREVQARAGLPTTAIPTASSGISAPATGAPGTPTAGSATPPAGLPGSGTSLPPPPPGAADPIGPGGWANPLARPGSAAPDADARAEEEEVLQSVTMARRRRPAPEPAAEQPATSARRRWIAVGAAAAAVAVVGAGIALVGGGDGEGGTSTTTATPDTPPDTFYDVLATPSDVTITAAGDGTFTVAIGAVEGATAYEIQPVGTPTDALTVEADALPATVQTDAPSLCVIVRALGDGGRASRTSDPVCSP